MDWSELIAPGVGIVGVLVGIGLGELLRRWHRAEQFALALFSRRLDAYETLLGLVRAGEDIAGEVIRNKNLSMEERHELISSAIHPIARFTDDNSLYIDEELAAHCVSLFMGVEDFPDLSDADREQALSHYRKMCLETRRMIHEESGVAKLNKLFRSINRPRITSPVIERIRELRRERGEENS